MKKILLLSVLLLAGISFTAQAKKSSKANSRSPASAGDITCKSPKTGRTYKISYTDETFKEILANNKKGDSFENMKIILDDGGFEHGGFTMFKEGTEVKVVHVTHQQPDGSRTPFISAMVYSKGEDGKITCTLD